MCNKVDRKVVFKSKKILPNRVSRLQHRRVRTNRAVIMRAVEKNLCRNSAFHAPPRKLDHQPSASDLKKFNFRMSSDNNNQTIRHPLINSRQRSLTNDAEKDLYHSFLLKEVEGKRCFDIKHRRELSCDCMIGVTEEELQGCSSFLVYFGKLLKQAQETKVLEWIKCSRLMPTTLPSKNKKIFLLPSAAGADDDRASRPICHHALQKILNIGHWQWTSICKQAKEGATEAHPHHLKGAEGNRKMKQDLEESLTKFFVQLEQLASPRSTSLVRLETGIEVRDDDLEVLELAPSMSRRGLYKRFCLEQGWNAETYAKGKYVYAAIDGELQEERVSWSTFCAFWNRNYPKLIVPRAREDICGDCYTFANAFRSLNSLRYFAAAGGLKGASEEKALFLEKWFWGRPAK